MKTLWKLLKEIVKGIVMIGVEEPESPITKGKNVMVEEPESPITKGKNVMVFDRYRFAIPLKAFVTMKSRTNDGVCVTLMQSNSKKYPIGAEIWVHEAQLKPQEA